MAQASSALLPATQPGRCRYCRCTDYRACEEGCSWHDQEHTVCDTERCVERFNAAVAKATKKVGK